jgi:hypothetical protein
MGRQAGLQRLQAQGLGLSNLADEAKLQQIQQAQADAALQRDQMNRNTTMGPNGPILNQQGYLSGLAQGGAAPMAYAEQGRFGAQEAAAQAAKIEKAQGEIKRRTQLLSGIKSPMQLAAAIPELEKQGVNVEEIRQIPFRSDWRQALDGMIQQGLSHSERMEQLKQSLAEQAATLDWQKADVDQQYKRTGAALDQAKLDETIRNNKAGTAVDWYKAQNPVALQGTKAPPGYRYTADGNMEAIPGGPADAKKIAADTKAQAGAQRATEFADSGIGTIDQLLASPGLGKITGWASKIPIIPGTEQAKANALAEQLEGQAFLQAFQSLKGGGAITETEGKKASAAIARLKRDQSKEDYSAALKELRGIMDATRKRASGAAPQAAETTPAQAKAITGKEDYDALPVGASYIFNGVPHVKGAK